MHVALVLMNGNSSFAGGVPAVVMARARYLVANGHRASIICRANHNLERPEIRDGIAIYPVRAANRVIQAGFAYLQSASPWFLRRLRHGLEAAHRITPIDLVDLQDGPAILGAGPFCKRHGIPMTFTLHGSAAVNPGRRPWIGRKLHIAYERMAYRAADRAIGVSAFIAQTPRLLGFADIPTTVVPNLIDELFLTLQRRADPYSTPFKLLSLARLVPEKRHAVTLQALALLPRGKFQLTIAGNGPERKALKALARDLGIEDDIVWLGHVSNRTKIADLIETSHALAFPTIHEAHSIALLEAIAGGLLPVVVDIPVIREAIPAKYCVTPDDPAALAARFAELNEDRSILVTAEEELRIFAQHYRKEVIYPKLLEEYSRAIEKNIQ
jgi:glycosyltransferase involved in cell wall biosynthesis